MTLDVTKMPLPSGPSTLCFSKDSFMKDDFDVDHFLMECRRRVSMETLRDDLGIYLKVLKSAMIELINKDYADFVNLSTNLVGMDKAIGNLTTPLGQLKEEVLSVQTSMDEAIAAIQEKLEQRRQIREKKACLQRLMNIIESVDKMESLLKIQDSGGSSDDRDENRSPSELSGQLIERVATQFNKLQFYVNKSRGTPLVEEVKPRITNITTTLQYSLEGSFKEGLERGDTKILRQCLRTYATIDKTKDAENLVRQYMVKPFMEDVITEEFIRSNPQGLKGMFAKILEFIPTHCKKIKEVTLGQSGQSSEVVRGYDFIVNAVWPEIVLNIEAKTPSVFAPGDPEVFHHHYLLNIDFLERFERQCGSQASVKRLRSHPSYNSYMAKWSLPVYFQIRFQEIAGALESSLLVGFNAVSDQSTGFNLVSAQTLWTCLHQNWTSAVYLKPLCHRFWKLTLQMISRYGHWVEEVANAELDKQPAATESSTTPGSQAIEGAQQSLPTPGVTTGQLVSLIVDTENIALRLPEFFEKTVHPLLGGVGFKTTDSKILEASIKDCQDILKKDLPRIGTFITDEVISQCSVHLKLVSDIPRLYRKTNREVPTKPSTYISSLLKPLQLFLGDHHSKLPEGIRQDWCATVLRRLTQQYLSITSDVLTSVKKMEDSLKRLKRAKSSAASANQGMSDDDKIRLQFSVDVSGFGEQMELLGIPKSDIEGYQDLFDLVENARKASSAS